jgi:DNA-binding PucR family transcriptional regulator
VAAQALHVHRHTMRNRIARIEHIAGKRLDTAQDRFELWLALRVRDLTRVEGAPAAN